MCVHSVYSYIFVTRLAIAWWHMHAHSHMYRYIYVYLCIYAIDIIYT